MDPSRNAAELVANAEGLILDFDGPVCDLFAGLPARTIASRLQRRFGLPDQKNDPLQYILDAVAEGRDATDLHDALALAEFEAAAVAKETDGVRRLIRSAGGPVGIASNNASCAIERWLQLAELGSSISHVEGREPTSMKPNPRSVLVTSASLGIPANECVFIGDSLSDLEAARGATMPFIGLANKPGKREAYHQRGCRYVLNGLEELFV